MTWLRIDDKFGQHPKILGLTDREFRVHVLTLCYCAEYATDGNVPRTAWKTLGITRKFARKFVDLGLWDDGEDADVDAFNVHDFKRYNPADPTAASRKARERSRNSHGESHGDVTEESRPLSRESHGPRAGAARPVPKEVQEQEHGLPYSKGKAAANGRQTDESSISDQIKTSLARARPEPEEEP